MSKTTMPRRMRLRILLASVAAMACILAACALVYNLRRGVAVGRGQRVWTVALEQRSPAEIVAALKRDVETRGGGHSGSMRVVRKVLRDLEAKAKHPRCDCSQPQQELEQLGQSLAACDCSGAAKPLPPPQLIQGEDCQEMLPDQDDTRGVRWLVDCESSWTPSIETSQAQPAEERGGTSGEAIIKRKPQVETEQGVEAQPVPPGEEVPGFETVVRGPEPDIFSPQEPWHALNSFRNEWHFNYDAAPYTGQYDDAAENDPFSQEEPWNDRPVNVVLDATLADLKTACMAAAGHDWNENTHECLHAGKSEWPEMPRGTGVTQAGPGRKALDGETPIGNVLDDAEELDTFGARRPEPAGEVDQFGWRRAPPPHRLRDTAMDYASIDVERACLEKMKVPGKGKWYSWDPARGKCLYLGVAVRSEAQDMSRRLQDMSQHPLTDAVYADIRRDCESAGGEWVYPRVDGEPGSCLEAD